LIKTAVRAGYKLKIQSSQALKQSWGVERGAGRIDLPLSLPSANRSGGIEFLIYPNRAAITISILEQNSDSAAANTRS